MTTADDLPATTLHATPEIDAANRQRYNDLGKAAFDSGKPRTAECQDQTSMVAGWWFEGYDQAATLAGGSHADMLNAIKNGAIPVGYDEKHAVYFFVYNGVRYNLTAQESEEVHATGGVADKMATAMLHGWDAILHVLKISKAPG